MPAGLGRSDAESALVAAYAAGTLSRPMHALVAGHLELCPRNRAFTSGLEELLGRQIDAIAPVELNARDARLEAIFGDTRSPFMADRAAPSDPGLPRSLAALLGRPLDTLRWRMVLPGVGESRIQSEAGTEACFYRIKAGRTMPAHTHEGLEATLVLRGSFSDENGHYEAGDIAVADDDVDHKPVAGPEGECLCFAVTEGNLKLTGPVARFLRRVAGRA